MHQTPYHLPLPSHGYLSLSQTFSVLMMQTTLAFAAELHMLLLRGH
ncbi:uncharacterized protein CTRU02_210751 [Colletotrichum truncatum]|uniref:Uncharacterized protein n=1 Tax=Colletotrichum truncatum TaxID=5467 RepID=A0ACC3YQ27_COLTU|nr:uncharacterized protein CTRU02_03762 [Colletotrichum truncatum]KAF6796784.1 hypothetical protein CTRU02_03762 [Colletotrichum truncatum]